MKRRAGVTLLEVLIAVTLLSVLSAGMMMAMRLGISALSRTDRKLMDNRRIAGAQRILEQELQGLIPIVAPCAAGGGGKIWVTIFSGQAGSVTLVSGFSLQEAWRGRPQILQIFTIPADDGNGSRLVVNEIPFTGREGAGKLCAAAEMDAESQGPVGHFQVPSASPTTFVLADHLREVHFSYLGPAKKAGEPGVWTDTWTRSDWPGGIRVAMAPTEPSPGRLQPITVTAPIYIFRNPGVKYEDR